MLEVNTPTVIMLEINTPTVYSSFIVCGRLSTLLATRIVMSVEVGGS